MSRIKESEAYQRHFQEVLREDNNSYERYLEELYLQQHEQPPQGTKNPNHNANNPRSPKK